MAATNQTSNYGLPQWLGSDKLERTDMNTAMADIDDNLNLVELKFVSENWIPVSFQNSWSNLSGFTPASYYKDNFGNVWIQGAIKGGVTTANTTIFTLPIGYRPQTSKYFIAHCSDGGTNTAYANIQVNSDGRVMVTKVPYNTHVDLSICFRAQA